MRLRAQQAVCFPILLPYVQRDIATSLTTLAHRIRKIAAFVEVPQMWMILNLFFLAFLIIKLDETFLLFAFMLASGISHCDNLICIICANKETILKWRYTFRLHWSVFDHIEFLRYKPNMTLKVRQVYHEFCQYFIIN